MVCHHIDWSGLQIKVATPNGQNFPIYTCILCDKEISPEDYKDTLKKIKERKENNTLRFWRTPKGTEHSEEECPEVEKCPIHGEESEFQ